MAAWFCGSVQWSAVTAWAASTAYSVGDIRRQSATPTVGNERVWRCTTAGTSGGTEPSWTLTKGSTTTDNTVVWTEITGNSTYGWTAAAARVENLNTWITAGDDVYIANDHTQTRAASVSISSPGTVASPCRYLCVDPASDPPTALSTGAIIAVTGSFNSVSFGGNNYVYGLTLRAGTSTNDCSITLGNNTNIAQWTRLDTCTLELLGSGSFGKIQPGPANNGGSTGHGLTEFINTTVKFGATSHQIYCYHQFVWKDTPSAIQGATIPSTLITFNGANMGAGDLLLQGVDLSAAGSGKSLVDISQRRNIRCQLIDCKLGASVSLTTGSHAGRGVIIEMINCDSSDTNYRFQRVTYPATEVQETTIVKSSGASDGTTTFSRKITTTANAKSLFPYESLPIEFWNETVGSAITVTVPVVTNGVTLTDAEAWIEVEYLGTSGYPLGNFEDDRAADIVFTTPANQPTDSGSTWTTTGLASPVKQTLDVTITPQEKGIVRVTVCLARATTVMYYDPLVVVT